MLTYMITLIYKVMRNYKIMINYLIMAKYKNKFIGYFPISIFDMQNENDDLNHYKNILHFLDFEKLF